MFKKILIALVVIIVVFAIVVATRPADFQVTRMATIGAPAAAMKQTYEGPAAGVGAISRWAGNNQVGEGSMTITESRPSEMIRFKLDFLKPMAGTSTAEFAFKPEGNQTTVTWSMAGKNNFIAKAMCMFMSMDKMVGGQFEQGLASIKSIVEAAPKP